jgi:hypothetical protein
LKRLPDDTPYLRHLLGDDQRGPSVSFHGRHFEPFSLISEKIESDTSNFNEKGQSSPDYLPTASTRHHPEFGCRTLAVSRFIQTNTTCINIH